MTSRKGNAARKPATSSPTRPSAASRDRTGSRAPAEPTSDRDSEPRVESLALRMPDAARAIGVSPRTLWSLVNVGEVPHVRVGRAVVFPVDLLREWLRRRAKGAGRGRRDSSTNREDSPCLGDEAREGVTMDESTEPNAAHHGPTPHFNSEDA